MIFTKIIFAYKTLGEANVSSPEHIFQYVAEVEPFFWPMGLLALFVIITLSTYFSEERRTGRGDFWTSFAVAGYITSIASFILMLIPGVVNILTVVVILIMSVIGTLMTIATNK